jgi:hypothetical protein
VHYPSHCGFSRHPHQCRIGYIDIAINEDGADIRVDDLPVGTSPLPTTVPVNAGPRRISAVKPGFAIAARNITVAGGDQVKVLLDMPEPVIPRGLAKRSPAARSVPMVARTESMRSETSTPLLISLVATASCAVATGVFAWLALDAKRDFDGRLDTFGSTKAQIDSDRSRMKNYALVADGLGAATLAAGGVSLFLALTRHSTAASEKRNSIAIAPTLGGMAIHGGW